jgi:hypothetical protein
MDMRRIPVLITLGAGFAALALAESFSGNLLDAGCYEKQKAAASCEATAMTTSFALDVSGKVLKLDGAGNSKASAALKNRADRAEPGKTQSPIVMAKIDGTEKGGMITVESIDVQ